MLYTYPCYYNIFRCIADKCPDTCCAGWKIVIDPDSIKRYHQLRDQKWEAVVRNVNWGEETFCQDEDRRCAFLQEDNLCQMILEMGESMLCKTCQLYPRHIEEFEDERDVNLSLSCPEVARILMKRTAPVTYYTKETDEVEEEEYEDFDFFFYSLLQDARDVMVKILKDRERAIELRALTILGIAHDMQAHIDRNEMFSCDEVFEYYQSEQAREKLSRLVIDWREKEEDIYDFAYSTFQKLFKLEHLNESWAEEIAEAKELLFYSDQKFYYHTYQGFQNYMAFDYPQWEIHAENLMIYYLYSYFCGSVYDGMIMAKTQMAVICTWLIHNLLMVRWMKKNHNLEVEDVIDVVYRFSRELENSDENLDLFWEMMEEEPLISKGLKSI